MVADTIEENSGYLQLTDNKHEKSNQKDPTIQKQAHQLLEYSKTNEHTGLQTSVLRSQQRSQVFQVNFFDRNLGKLDYTLCIVNIKRSEELDVYIAFAEKKFMSFGGQ